MESQAVFRAAMVLTIPVLLALILLTPGLIGRPPPEITSLPLLVIGMSIDERWIVLDVSGAFQAYMYEAISLSVVTEPEPDINASGAENFTYDVHLRVPVNLTLTYVVHAWVLDRTDSYFEVNVTMSVLENPSGDLYMAFGMIDDPSPTTIVRVPPDDLRVPVTRKGTI